MSKKDENLFGVTIGKNRMYCVDFTFRGSCIYAIYNHINGKYNVLGVFDDRDQVVSVWRSLGLTCFQVNWGNF